MDILYFCSPPLLDYSAEQIKDLKQHVRLHIMVWVSLHTPDHTIFKLRETDFSDGIYTFDAIKDKIENADLFEQYFEGCKSVHFLFFPPRLGINIIWKNIKLFRFLKTINPQIVHFDDISGRLLIFALLLKKQKIVLNVHDPTFHSGEQNRAVLIMRKLLFNKISAFCTFSNFSKQLFERIYNPGVPLADLRLVPYRSYLFLGNKVIKGIDKVKDGKVLLFFGRISPYKGIDELLLAFSKVLKRFPNIKLVIAGKGSYTYQLPKELVGSSSIILINRFIIKNEIKSLFEQADVIICPYRDATQSGVIMTASVFNIPAIVSNVGALPEYVKDGTNGYVYDLADDTGLENAIIRFLIENKFSDKTATGNIYSSVARNSQLLVNLYSQLVKNR